MKHLLVIFATLMLLASVAVADIVSVEMVGEVEYSQVNSGPFGAVNSGDAFYASFTLDSEVWEPSPNGYGVRGYPIDVNSFELTIGSVGPVLLVNPQPNGETTYFNLRNADPVADGLFISNQLEWDNVLPKLNVPGGIDPYFTLIWSIGYTEETFSSLDILDALGTYNFDGLTSFYCAIKDAFADPIGLIPTMTVISSPSVAIEEASFGSVKALYR
jgi:hypothetical protein